MTIEDAKDAATLLQTKIREKENERPKGYKRTEKSVAKLVKNIMKEDKSSKQANAKSEPLKGKSKKGAEEFSGRD